MFKHGIEDGEQLAHAGGEGDFLGFARSLQSVVEGPSEENGVRNRFRLARGGCFVVVLFALVGSGFSV